MSAAGNRLHLRLFLEGIEVPVIAIQCQGNPNAPATAVIQVVPTDALLNLKARTMVHAFYWDSTLDLETVDDPLKGYKQMFAGEVIGLQMMKTPIGRQAVLQCADFSTYWDTTYQFMIDFSPNGNFLQNGADVWAGGATTFNNILSQQEQVLRDHLLAKPQTPGLQDISGLMGGIISLLEVMGGIPNKQAGVNDFFTIAELKNHLMQQLVAEQNDSTAQRLFDDKVFMDFIKQGLGSLGQLTTFRDMLKLLFNFIYYECVPNLTPMYVQGTTTKTIQTAAASSSPSDTLSVKNGFLLPASAAASMGSTDALKAATFGGDTSDDGTAPDNVLATLSNIQDRADTISEALAGYYEGEDEQPSNSRSQAADMRDQLKAIIVANPDLSSEVVKRVNSAIMNLDSASRKDPNSNNETEQDKYTSYFYLAASSLGLAVASGGSTAPQSQTPKAVETQKISADRINAQIFRPDCFFVAPPKCNVFFPEVYTAFNFSRNYLQEVTRLRLQMSWAWKQDEADDPLITPLIYAPNSADIRALAKKQGNSDVRALLPWEIYSGILPKFETIPEINLLAQKSEKEQGVSSDNKKIKSVSYSQRVANYNYFKYRFASRACDVSMKFNPFVALGFPAVLITQPFSPTPEQLSMAVTELTKEQGKQFDANKVSDNIRDVAKIIGAPSHFLGMVAGVAHSISQDGGVTNVTMTHSRTHRITDDDFINLWLTEVTKNTQTRTVATTYDANIALSSGDYKSLQLLIDATDQSSVTTAPLQDRQEAAATPDLPNQVSLTSRPTGMPDLSGQPLLAPFVLLNPDLPNIAPGTPAVVISNQVQTASGPLPLRGGVVQSVLKGTRTKIFEPSPYSSKLKPGSKGPNGGTVVQIECQDTSVISVTAADIAKAPTKNTSSQTRANANVKDPTTFFLWRKIVIHESVTDPAGTIASIPVEEALRPPWFSPNYSNWFIGDNIYKPFFGCGSVADAAVFTTPSGSGSFGTNRATQSDLLAKLSAADGDSTKMAQVVADIKTSDLATDAPDVESSIDALAYIYGEIRRMGLDVHKFVNDYTRRPVASMRDIFGSDDLQYAVSGQALTLKSGTPGFHSTAIAPYGNLLGLTDNPDTALPRLDLNGAKYPISKDLDPRPGRRAAVQAYQISLETSTGALGIGLRG